MTAFTAATREYEDWMRAGLPHPPGPDEAAIEFKHDQMADGESAFPFLRATFYRWAQRWLSEAGDLAQAPAVLAVGDLHIENFGTWRDRDRRLIWGVNDFDETWELPWTSDLVRLGVSASLAVKRDDFHLKTKEVCQLILDGYKEGLKAGKIEAFDLDNGHDGLRRLVEKAFKSDDDFWEPFDDPKSKWRPINDPPANARTALHDALPKGAIVEGYREQHGPYEGDLKPAGLGSLGRPRYCVLAHNEDKRLVRETKALLPSAAAWATRAQGATIKIGPLLANVRRCPDPWLKLHGAWIVRRISRKAVKVSIDKLEKDGFAAEDEEHLFHAMGRETANIHLASTKAGKLLDDLRARRDRDADWFVAAVRSWRAKVGEDWDAFKSAKT